MGHIFMTAVNAVFPVIGLILLGYILRRKNILSESFLKTGNRLIPTAFFPFCIYEPELTRIANSFVYRYGLYDRLADVKMVCVEMRSGFLHIHYRGCENSGYFP